MKKRTSFHYSGDEYAPIYVSSSICDLLVAKGDITHLQAQKALLTQKRSKPEKKIGEILLELGFIDEKALALALAEQLGLSYLDAEQIQVDEEVLGAIPIEYAHTHCILPYRFNDHRLEMLMEDPTDLEVLQMLHFMTGRLIEPYVSTRSGIQKAISKLYGRKEDADILHSLGADGADTELSEEKALKIAKDKPTVRLVSNLLTDAIQKGTSDIHIRPQENNIEILFRIDGQLDLTRTFPKAVLPAIVSRIKVIGGMDITERRLPQDGRIRVRSNDHVIDMRVSIMPSIYGESVVIRLLDSTERLLTVEELGLGKVEASAFKSLLNRGSGLILVTGPTGSGKSTTLYAALQQVRTRNINIITVEDPVEYRMAGITQIQVNADIGYTFSRALRNILRHDPDAIMIGEMRDFETAKIAVESSLTGHLVLSTLHTNDSASTITRLLEMGIQDYLVRSTLIAVLSQRLVRKNCQHCLAPEPLNDDIAKELRILPGARFYRSTGCSKCGNTGYKGRLAVYEFLIVNDKLKTLIQSGVSADIIKKAALESGMKSLYQQGVIAAKKGWINVDQLRIIKNS